MTAPTVLDGAELRALTERMGLSVVWLAREWGVSEGNIKRWMKGSHPIPSWVADDLASMVADTERQLAIMVDVAKAKCDRGALMMLTTYRNDYELDELPPEDPVTRYNAAWHRNLCTRVMEQVPGVRLRYAFRPRSNRGEDK